MRGSHLHVVGASRHSRVAFCLLPRCCHCQPGQHSCMASKTSTSRQVLGSGTRQQGSQSEHHEVQKTVTGQSGRWWRTSKTFGCSPKPCARASPSPASQTHVQPASKSAFPSWQYCANSSLLDYQTAPASLHHRKVTHFQRGNHASHVHSRLGSLQAVWQNSAARPARRVPPRAVLPRQQASQLPQPASKAAAAWPTPTCTPWGWPGQNMLLNRLQWLCLPHSRDVPRPA
jgi:hypothetical protein